jgi:hypothetical protein
MMESKGGMGRGDGEQRSRVEGDDDETTAGLNRSTDPETMLRVRDNDQSIWNGSWER